MTNAIELNDTNFDTFIKRAAASVVLVDFWTSCRTPCRSLAALVTRFTVSIIIPQSRQHGRPPRGFPPQGRSHRPPRSPHLGTIATDIEIQNLITMPNANEPKDLKGRNK